MGRLACGRRRGSAAGGLVVAALALAFGAAPAPSDTRTDSGAISYKTLFQDPGETPVQDLSLEAHAVSLINATPAGERITFAFRDFNRQPVANALIAAHARGALVDGVIDGDERRRAVVQALQSALGPDRVVVCGSPTFEFNSCIANVDPPSLQHNKFLTFSRLDDGREDVVLQTSKNFLAPSQLTYYNDMIEITGDAALHDAYVDYLFALKAQVRSDDHYVIRSGDDGRNTMFPSPRRQADRSTDDTIVDRMNEIDCSEGGSPSGRGLIRIANMAFRSERAAIMRKLVALARDGCDIDVVLSLADGDIMAGLVSAGVPVHPFFLRSAGARPQVIVHDKFWLVDAKSRLTGTRTRITYAGSSNWRGDQQRSDDLLLRIADDGVYSAYSEYWEKMRSRAVSDLPRPVTDEQIPASAHVARPPANAEGWNRSDVTVRVAGSDGHVQTASGLERLHVETTGAQSGSWDFPGETSGYNVQELLVSAEGATTVTYFSEDHQRNLEPPGAVLVKVDKTAPSLVGLPRGCTLRPRNHKLVHVADVSATDGHSGIGTFSVSASSNASDDEGDIVVTDGSVYLRAELGSPRRHRIYTVSATATDVAGNRARSIGRCVVRRPGGRRPHSSRCSRRGWSQEHGHHPRHDASTRRDSFAGRCRHPR